MSKSVVVPLESSKAAHEHTRAVIGMCTISAMYPLSAPSSTRRDDRLVFRMRGPRRLFVLIAWALLAGATARDSIAQSETDDASLTSGVFSADQVERGRERFDSECMDCHELEEFTGPGAFLEEQEGETLWSVFEFIWSEMPEDKPAWLEPSEYADILSFILSVYGFPSGDSDLSTDKASLEKIRIAAPEGSGS